MLTLAIMLIPILIIKLTNNTIDTTNNTINTHTIIDTSVEVETEIENKSILDEESNIEKNNLLIPDNNNKIQSKTYTNAYC
jgi:hypothetical protein